jgi:phage baseplate assembly protein W|tara:strand:- start:126 stop:629 length:504 start_codon:yes stop_codon:yes gene_type:complete
MAQNQSFLNDYTKHVKSTSKRQSRKFKDLDLDFGRHPITNDVNVVEDAIAIKRAVRNLVQTNFYERPFHPELGCGVRELLFENYSPVTNVFIKRKIEECLVNHEPRIQLTGIRINEDEFGEGSRADEIAGPIRSTAIDENRLQVEIYFNIIGVPNPQSVSVTLQRIR